ncbi:hypothetical protein H072_10565 [Dactylellina haptotyla CBS 200.50]|uniref:Methyltransferase domain-containing protein n=1 Tax=Dactylellina haptotyla (strain CBS 200.50) TaxID=1284197 RepID=S7ZYZ3_DACHA|nr:hypothetical protein H072_10565 [Dactylellina haptotyla CBS 200.50]
MATTDQGTAVGTSEESKIEESKPEEPKLEEPKPEEPLAPAEPEPPMSPVQEHFIEFDYSATSSDEYDSLYGSDYGSATTSLSDSVRNYKYENGRRYHAYKEGQWVMPNDEVQQEQMDLMHHVFLVRLGGRLFLAPIENPQKIMDVGTGTGIWAMQVAEDHPAAAVMGNDLSPIQPTWVPPNISFEVDDFNEPWLQTPESFDLIHSRDLHAAVTSWPFLVGQAYEKLRPGGWYESQEHTVEITTDDGSVPEGNILKEWVRNLEKASVLLGRELHPPRYMKDWLKDAGFVNVRQETYKLPIGTWPKDPVEKQIGAMNLVNMLDAAEGYTLGFYTRYLGKSHEETLADIELIKKNLKTRKFHMYFQFCITYGQKPEW